MHRQRNGVLLLGFVAAAVPLSDARADCPGDFYDAVCNTGGTDDVCTWQPLYDVVCDLDTTLDSSPSETWLGAGFDAYGVYLYGYDSSGEPFCCPMNMLDDDDWNNLTVYGSPANDVIDMTTAGYGCPRWNDMTLGAGDDEVYGSIDGEDDVDAGTGTDTLEGNGGNDTLDGGPGDDTLLGGDGEDVLRGGAGMDTLDGGGEADTLYSMEDVDDNYGAADEDWLFGRDGSDTMYGDAGVDYMDGGQGQDTLYGWKGNDNLCGGPSSDHLYGGQDADQLFGGDGSDVHDGGLGQDRCENENKTSCERPNITTCPFVP